MQKRRIYDITNVLEGIGLIHKLPKGVIKWANFGYGDVTDNLESNRKSIMKEVVELESEESDLIGKIQYVQETLEKQLQFAREDGELYLNEKDLQRLVGSWPCNLHCLGVTMPPGTKLDISWKRNWIRKSRKRRKKEQEEDDTPKLTDAELIRQQLVHGLTKKPNKLLSDYNFNLHMSNKDVSTKEKVPIDVHVLSKVSTTGPSSSLPSHSLSFAKHNLLKHKFQS